LTNPIYADAYAFGRTTSRISVVDGRKRVRRGVHRPMDQWDVLIKDHHVAYISWDEFERNLKAIANNATGMSSALARGAAREGELLLPGLLRCGHSGRKLHVHYGGKLDRYNCYGARMNHGTERCISVSGLQPVGTIHASGRHYCARARAGSTDAGSSDCTLAQSHRHRDRTWQRMDAGARARLPQSLRD
jgi:hypothetical protein